MREVGHTMLPQDRLLVGNWNDANFVSQLGSFDTILADYLIGAVDGFRYGVHQALIECLLPMTYDSPYTQDLVIDLLKDHLAPHGYLYIIGMHPIPDVSTYPASIVRCTSTTQILPHSILIRLSVKCGGHVMLPSYLRAIVLTGTKF